MNLMDVNREFRTEEDCLEELAEVRWPDGIRCITCGCKDISRITRKPTAKNKRTRSFQCLEKTCKQQFTATPTAPCSTVLIFLCASGLPQSPL